MTNMTLSKAQVKYVEANLNEKSIIRIARELTKEAKLPKEKRIRRIDIIEYFKEKFERNIVEEKFGK